VESLGHDIEIHDHERRFVPGTKKRLDLGRRSEAEGRVEVSVAVAGLVLAAWRDEGRGQ
jgi:hypothetical protein